MKDEITKRILLKLIHKPVMSFNELWDKDGGSNGFNYHLKKLIDDGIVEKNDGKYRLTSEGKRLSAFIEGDDGNKAKFPTLTVVVLAKKGDQFLCQRRLKQPFYGLWGFVSGKINFGLNIMECAKRDLLEETGLVADSIKLKGLVQAKTYEKGKMLHHHYLFVTMACGLNGELKTKTHKAEHDFFTFDEFKALEDKFPILLEEFYDSESCGFKIVEVNRFIENGKFSHDEIVNVMEF